MRLRFKSEDTLNLFFCLLLYVATTVFLPLFYTAFFILLFTVASILQRRKVIFSEIDKVFFVGLLPVIVIYMTGQLFASDFILLNPDPSNSFIQNIYNSFPAYLFLVITIFCSKYINSTFYKVFVFLVIFEALIVFLEKYLGVTTIIESHFRYREYESALGRFYFSRTLGLSDTPSIIGLKIVIATSLINFDVVNFQSKKIKYGLNILFIVASLFVFSRAAIMGMIILYTVKFSNKKINQLIVNGSVVAIFFIVFYYQLDYALLDPKNRIALWSNILQFIGDNPVFGNYGIVFSYTMFGEVFHAHNFVLQTLSNNGIIIGSIILGLFLYVQNKTNYKVVTPLIIFSVFNLGILWGFSFIDLIYFSLIHMLHEKNVHISKKKNLLFSE